MLHYRKKWHPYLAILLTVFMTLSSLPVSVPVTGAAADTVTSTVYDTTAGAESSPYWQNGKLTAGNINLNNLTLSWSGATDDVGVTGYNIYRDGTLLAGNTNFNPFYVNGLQTGAQYTFTVQALNAAGKESTDGPSVTVTTHTSGEKIIANAAVGTIYMDYTHLYPVTTGGLDTWIINVPNATFKAGVSNSDLTIDNFPHEAYYGTTRLDDHNIAFNMSGWTGQPITLPYTVTVSLKPSAVTDPDMLASDTIPLIIKEVTSVWLNKNIDTLSKGNSEQLVATVIPADAPDKSVNWTTSDSSVATVDNTGLVTAVGTGTTAITATVVSGLSASCAVTVTPDASQTPVTVDSLYTDHIGKKIIVKFGKAMADPAGTQGQFTAKVNGSATSVTGIAPGANPDELVLALASQAKSGTAVTLSYAKGTVTAADGSLLDSFNDYAVANNYVAGGVVNFSPDATELSYDSTNQIMKFRFDAMEDYDSVTDIIFYISNGFGDPSGGLFISNLNNYVKFYEKDTGIAAPLPPPVLASNATKQTGFTNDWYYFVPSSGRAVGLNLTSCALKPSTTYVIDILKGFAYNNGGTTTVTDSFEFTTTATSSSKPVWPAGSSLTVTNPAGASVTLNWQAAQYHPTSLYPTGWQAGYNTGVTGYNIYQNGDLLTTVAGETATSYQVTSLTPGTSYQFSVKAVDQAGQLSEALETTYDAALLISPVVTADTPNQAGSAVNLTFADDPAWRAAISGITVDGAPLNSIQYTVTAGKISIAPGVLNTDASHTIVISATNYQDATVAQSTETTAPALTAHEILPGSAAELTFTDNPAWRAAVSGITVDGAVYLTGSQYVVTPGHIYIVAGILNTAGDHTVAVSAHNYTDTTVSQKVVAVLTPPVLTAQEAFPNSVVDLTFTDNEAWRAAISGVSVDGTALTDSQYVVTAGHLKIAAGVLTTTGSHTIAVSATNYTDTIVTQNIAEVLTPPALTPDSTDNLPGNPVDITFTDDASWRAAVSGVTVDGSVYLTGSQYTVTPGNLNIAANILKTGGSHTITVKADQYTDASVTQVIRLITRFDNLPEGTITTVAGAGGSSNGYGGDNGPATGAKLYNPAGTAVDNSSGALYIADYNNYRIRKVDLSGVITTVAGTGTSGYSGDGGPATQANISRPIDLVVDGGGNLYFTDNTNYRVRKVDTNGIITTVAGTGTSGYSGDGGPATQVTLKSVSGLDLDQAGNLYIADASNNRIRKVDVTTGIITTVAGTGTAGTTGDGGPATQANLKKPNNVGLDSAGNLYITEGDSRVVRRVDAGGTITTVAGITGTSGFAGDGGPATQAKLYNPYCAFYDTNEGGLYIADYSNNCIRFVKLKQVAAMPSPSLPSGGAPSGTTVTLSTATAGAAIYYTTDGSTPTSASTLYSGPITIDLSCTPTLTIKAVAVKAGLSDSFVMTVSYALPYNTPAWPADTQVTASTITAAELTLTWTPAVDNVAVTGYQIYENGTLLDTVNSTTTYNVTGLTAGASYEFKLKACNASGIWNDFSPALTVRTLPALIADNSDNVLGKAVDFTFADDTAWRAAITGVTVDGTALTSSPYTGYTVTAGNVNIVASTFKTAGDHNIVVKAANYGDNAMVQNISTPLTPPVLTADSSDNTLGNAVDITFNDDAVWRAAITGVKINGVALNGSEYTLSDGNLSIKAEAFSLPGYYSIVVSATNYADTTVTQNINSTGIRQDLDIPDGYVTTVAGQGGTSGFSGDGGQAKSALFKNNYGVATDAAGNLYITDTNNYRVRKVDVNGNITTIAGNGTSGNTGDNGPALQAKVNPTDVAVDSKGNMYIADANNGVVRKVDPSGIITTVVSSLSQPRAVAVDSSNNLYVADNYHNKIIKMAPNGTVTTVAGTGGSGYSGDGGPATSANINSNVFGLAVDKAGNIYLSDSGNNRLRKVDAASGIITTVAGTGTSAVTGDGGPAIQASLNWPTGLTLDSEGNLYITNNNGTIRRVDAAGIITTVAGSGATGFAGDGGPAIQAKFGSADLFYDQNAGGLYVGDQSNNCVRFVKLKPVAATPTISLPDGAVVTGTVVSLKTVADVTLSTATVGADIYYTTDGSTPTTASTRYTGPVTIDKAVTIKAIAVKTGLTDSFVLTRNFQIGNTVPPVLTADSTDNMLGKAIDIVFTDDPAWRAAVSSVKVDDKALTNSQYTLSSGNLNLATSLFNEIGNHPVVVSAMGYQDTSVGQAIYATMDIPDGYITIVAGKPNTSGFSGDDGPAISALLNSPNGTTVDSEGNLYIADYSNYRIRKVDTSRMISTVAGNGTRGSSFSGDGIPALQAALGSPMHIAVDGAGNIYIPDTDTHRIREVAAVDHTQYGISMKAGYIYTIAGNGTSGSSGDDGQATDAAISDPYQLTIDNTGNLFFSDGSRIRKVDTNGIITTVAGTGTSGYSGDGGLATQAQIERIVFGLYADQAGNLYLSDSYNNRIRKVNTSGIITTIAGTGTAGCAGDGGQATAAQVYPGALTMDAAGNMYFSDSNRIRQVDTSGVITTIAGNGTQGYNGDGGPATQASIVAKDLVYDSKEGGLYLGQYYAVRFIKLSATSAPQLTVDSTDNTAGHPVEITFIDAQAWRSRNTDITVDGASIAGRYTVASGKITIDASVFGTAKVYPITVKATGYADATVNQPIVIAAYALTPTTDAAYQPGTTSNGITIMTVNTGVTGLKYFGVQIAPVKAHSGLESVIFLQTGSQSGLGVVRADFDTVNIAKAGFNVLPGDVVKVYIVDDLTNDPNFNPTILQ